MGFREHQHLEDSQTMRTCRKGEGWPGRRENEGAAGSAGQHRSSMGGQEAFREFAQCLYRNICP